MTPETRKAHARALLDDALIQDLFAEAEQRAFMRLLHADPKNHLAMIEAQASLRAVRNLHADLLNEVRDDNSAARSGIA